MTINDIWYVLFVVIIAGYLILDGFDMGVGILHPFVAKNGDERRVTLGSIGPVWDGNEVWLILGGGALFAAFPLVYASLFSGFYTAMMLVLLVMILRTVSIELRSKKTSARWRGAWDSVFFLTSFGLALLLGVAFGNIITGVPIDSAGDMQVSLFGLLTPFPLLIGVTTVVMLTMHGAIYLELRTLGEMQQRARRIIPPLVLTLSVLLALCVAATVFFRPHLMDNYHNYVWLAIVPACAMVALLMTWRLSRAGRYLHAFIASSLVIALSVITAAIGMFPNLLISSTDPLFHLTIYNGASAANTLEIMLVIALIGMPLVLLYHAVAYTIFRGKTQIDSRSY